MLNVATAFNCFFYIYRLWQIDINSLSAVFTVPGRMLSVEFFYSHSIDCLSIQDKAKLSEYESENKDRFALIAPTDL